jgi:uncharacterized protein
MTDIVDVRGRPTDLDPFYAGEPGSEREARIAWVNRRVGSADPLHFTASTDREQFLAEAEKAGIATTVVVGRHIPRARVPNDRVAEYAAASERFVGIGAVDPSEMGVVAAVAEVRRAVGDLGLRGINMDPGLSAVPMLPHDRRLYPVYAECEHLGVPVFLMSGPLAGPTLEYTLPRHFDAVASDFPDLDIVIAHGAYPFADEAVGVAYKHERVHLSPDIYTFMAGAESYVKGLDGFLADQYLFGTGYPFRGMDQTVQEHLALPLAEETMKKIMGGNTRRLLRLA